MCVRSVIIVTRTKAWISRRASRCVLRTDSAVLSRFLFLRRPCICTYIRILSRMHNTIPTFSKQSLSFTRLRWYLAASLAFTGYGIDISRLYPNCLTFSFRTSSLHSRLDFIRLQECLSHTNRRENNHSGSSAKQACSR